MVVVEYPPHRRWILSGLRCRLSQEGRLSIGPNGTVLHLESGLYGDLFPEGAEAESYHAVLALEVIGAGEVTRHLVPETESIHPESSATVLYDKASNMAHLLWESLDSGIHPLLFLTSFDGESWSEVIEITGSVFASKGHPQLVVSHGEEPPPLKDDAEAAVELVDRRVVNVAWWENAPFGSYKRYAPLLFLDGQYLGRVPIQNLSSFGTENDPGRPPQSAGHLENLLQIQPGASASSVVVGFTNRETGRLMTQGIELLPTVLSRLAQEVHSLVLDHGKELPRIELADFLYNQILELGDGFHPGSLLYVADAIRLLTLAQGEPWYPGKVPPFAEKAGVHIIHVGARFKSNGLQDPSVVEVLEISEDPLEPSSPLHHLKVSILSDRELPAAAAEGAQLFLSRSGREVLVAWHDENLVYYVESEGDRWSAQQQMELSERVSLGDAYRILEEHILGR